MWYRHEHNLCLRHLLWTGPGAGHPRDQADLGAHPDIVRAQSRHQRLIREHGRGIVHTAYRTAREIWETLTYRGWGLPVAVTREMHLAAWFGHRDWAASAQDPGPPRGRLRRGHHPHRPAGLTAMAAVRHVGVRRRP
jgi:hypothetical protein